MLRNLKTFWLILQALILPVVIAILCNILILPLLWIIENMASIITIFSLLISINALLQYYFFEIFFIPQDSEYKESFRNFLFVLQKYTKFCIIIIPCYTSFTICIVSFIPKSILLMLPLFMVFLMFILFYFFIILLFLWAIYDNLKDMLLIHIYTKKFYTKIVKIIILSIFLTIIFTILPYNFYKEHGISIPFPLWVYCVLYIPMLWVLESSFYNKFCDNSVKILFNLFVELSNIILFIFFICVLAYGNIGFLQGIFFSVILSLLFINKVFVKNPKITNFFAIIIFIALTLGLLTFFGTTFSPEENTWLLSMVIITILVYKTKNAINFKEILGRSKVEKEKYSFLTTLAQRYKKSKTKN